MSWVRFGVWFMALAFCMGYSLHASQAPSTVGEDRSFSEALDSLEHHILAGSDSSHISRWESSLSQVIKNSARKDYFISLLSDTLEHKSRLPQIWSARPLMQLAEFVTTVYDLHPDHVTASCQYEAWYMILKGQRAISDVSAMKKAALKAVVYAEQMFDHFPSRDVGLCKFYLGHACTMQGDNFQALRFYEQAAQNFIFAEGEKSMSLSKCNLIISGMYVNIGLYDQAVALGQEVMRSRLENPEAKPRDLSGAAINLVTIFREGEEFDSCLQYLSKASAFLAEGEETNPMAWRDIYDAGYHTYHRMMKDSIAMVMADSFLIYTAQMGNLGTRDEAKGLLYKAQAAIGLQRFEEAELLSHRSMAILFKDYHADTGLPQFHHLDPEEPWVQTALSVRGTALLHISRRVAPDQEQELLLDALHHLRLACDQVDNLRKSISTGGARLDLADATYEQYESGILIAHRLHQLTGEARYLAEAWEFMERSKAMALITELNSLTARESALPDSLQATEAHLSDEIVRLELSERNAPADQKGAIHASLLKAQEQQQSFIQQIEQQYPAYHQIKYDVQLQTLDSLQSYLRARKATLMEYFLSEEAVYVFTADGRDARLRSFKMEDSWMGDLEDFCNGVSGLRNFASTDQALDLSALLFRKLIGEDVRDSTRIIVVPDGKLWSLPFEALVTAPSKDFRSAHWLLRRNAIQYAYSSNFLLRLPGFKLNGNGQLLAYAPSFGGEEHENRGFGRLTHNGDEAREVAAVTGGTLRTGVAATEAHFRQEAPQYTVLHIASHARMRKGAPDSTGIAFQMEEGASMSDGFLSVPELRTLRLNAELAVLSACETGDGKLVRGEGLMSLSRSFTHSGCRSLVMSLWPVDDQATSIVMEEFYENLAKGKEKDEALRLAKLSYLSQGNPHPAKWAAFVSLGAPDSIRIESGKDSNPWWVLASLAVFLLLVLGAFGRQNEKP